MVFKFLRYIPNDKPFAALRQQLHRYQLEESVVHNFKFSLNFNFFGTKLFR